MWAAVFMFMTVVVVVIVVVVVVVVVVAAVPPDSACANGGTARALTDSGVRSIHTKSARATRAPAAPMPACVGATAAHYRPAKMVGGPQHTHTRRSQLQGFIAAVTNQMGIGSPASAH